MTADGVRYRIVRADEFARIGGGRLSRPGPPTRTTTAGTWTRPESSRTKDFVVDHAAAVGLAKGRPAGLLQLDTADRFPYDVRADSQRALTTHPGVVLLPTKCASGVAGAGGAVLVDGDRQHATPQAARRALVDHRP
ncbi:hypothetical protein SALBM217S_09852 [Streptomyces griseoloalbus]